MYKTRQYLNGDHFKGPDKILDDRMKSISQNLALTLIYNFNIFQLA